MNPVLTTLALKAAEQNTSTWTGLAYPNAKLVIDTPDTTISARGGSRTAQARLSTHSLLIMISEEKPKSTLAMESNR